MYEISQLETLEVIGPQPNPVLYVVANPVRGLLDRKRLEEHVPSSHEGKRNPQQTNAKDTGTMCVPSRNLAPTYFNEDSELLPVAPVAQRYLVTL